MADDATATPPITSDPAPDTTAQESETKTSDAPLEQPKEELNSDVAADEGSDDGECLSGSCSE